MARAMALLVVVLAGCTCQGKGQPGSDGAAQKVAEAAPEVAPQKVELKADRPPAGRFDQERTGFVKAKLGDKVVEFTVLPRTQNRVALLTKPPLVVVDAYATEGGKEHLRVHIQGVDFMRAKGREVTPNQDKSWLVAITYQDGEGKTWAGRAGRAGDVRVDISDVDPKTQGVSGSFSGTLRDASSDAVLEVVDGAFKTTRG